MGVRERKKKREREINEVKKYLFDLELQVHYSTFLEDTDFISAEKSNSLNECPGMTLTNLIGPLKYILLHLTQFRIFRSLSTNISSCCSDGFLGGAGFINSRLVNTRL